MVLGSRSSSGCQSSYLVVWQFYEKKSSKGENLQTNSQGTGLDIAVVYMV